MGINKQKILLKPAKILGEKLPKNVTRVQIEDLFAQYGPLNTSLIVTKNDGFTITFKRLMDAQKAIEALSGKYIQINGMSIMLQLRFSRFDKIKLGVLSGNQRAISLYSEMTKSEKKTKSLINYVKTSTKGLIEAQMEALPKTSMPSSIANSILIPCPTTDPLKTQPETSSKGVTSKCIIKLLTGDYKAEANTATIDNIRLEEAKMLICQGFGGYKLLENNLHGNYAIPVLPRLVDNKLVIS
ncbi:conserved Plasmodium protein, unknown function [Babesia microti strain RI]|uniref:RRM domain-containing protein n=1 Tax=Babesia microti (strain RI) TaxID=1133968 RepID=A0A1R4ABB2_BABMR|nr:conserved Plasmodium protein, unknown function [Babesia microti strain RI]SJK86311.1 conserved Plasmodium protein, unknown function [Babesia microti strain RI]|eukprot:XP_021338484.1 conserved Plasmodium protein, unknown function [Babesia microti strain RI]